MAIDNSGAIRTLMHFEISGDVYYIQVMQRGKDKGNDRDHVIKDFHIHSLDQFDKEWPAIVEMCEKYNARAMIRLNQRNTMDANIRTEIECLVAQLEINRALRKMIRTGNTSAGIPKILSAHRLYSSALGKTCTEDASTKKWIIDIDPDMVDAEHAGFESLDAIVNTFSDFIEKECAGRIYCTLPSKHGKHLVTSTFRKDTFMNHFGRPEKQHDYIMDDANTNLYIPDGL